MRRVTLLGCVLLAGCAGVQPGPPVALEDIPIPTVVQEAAKPPVTPTPPLPVPPSPREGLKLWIVRTTTPNGDVTEGHYVDVSAKAPAKDLVKPAYVVPKTPRQVYRPASSRQTPAGSAPTPLPRERQESLPPPLPLGLPVPQEGAYGLPQP